MPVKTAKKVLKEEAQAILRMSGRLSSSFGKAVNTIYKARGPAIVVGMGKPSFIGQKISASMASTGTPSFALHPADALHGDIGRITSKSVVLLLSNSGQTDEILKLLPLLKLSRCKLISITGNVKSTMAKASDIVLDASVVREAEPLEAAPTVSTTCMLAMGDALTMALVKKRRFKEQDFAMLHPGGSLGRRLRMRVKDVMRTGKKNPLVKPNASVRSVLLAISKARAGSATVVDAKGGCAGIFTDGDLRRHFTEMTASGKRKIAHFMTPHPLTVNENTLAVKALAMLRKRQFDEMPVVNNAGKVTGLLDVQDLLSQGFALPEA